MKIRKLTASFGKLDHESLSFHEGLNVIYAASTPPSAAGPGICRTSCATPPGPAPPWRGPWS